MLGLRGSELRVYTYKYAAKLVTMLPDLRSEACARDFPVEVPTQKLKHIENIGHLNYVHTFCLIVWKKEYIKKDHTLEPCLKEKIGLLIDV